MSPVLRVNGIDEMTEESADARAVGGLDARPRPWVMFPSPSGARLPAVFSRGGFRPAVMTVLPCNAPA